MIKITQMKLSPVKGETDEALLLRVQRKAARMLHLDPGGIRQVRLLKKSIDARKKSDILVIVTALVETDREESLLKKYGGQNILPWKETSYDPMILKPGTHAAPDHRIVIAGFGPCGLFCAYILALNGLKPLVLERGRDADRRQADVDRFWKEGILNPTSNVQFGEGGAGTFSDGKLNTQIKDPTGRIGYVLKTLHGFGASPKILYEQHPHVGTDVLKNVVKNMRQAIIDLGGEVRFDSCVSDLNIEDGTLRGVTVRETDSGRQYLQECSALVLAIGHSARDTFVMLKSLGVPMEAKDFAVGYRVQHPQRMINESQYGPYYADFFEPAPYKLTARAEDGSGVYSFCMCPGGYVVDASSEEGRSCVNGMSYADRGSENANSAVVVTVKREDLAAWSGSNPEDPLAGMNFQRMIEARAYQVGGGRMVLQSLGDYRRNAPSAGTGEHFTPMVQGRYVFGNLRGIYPDKVEKAFLEGMDSFGRSIRGFDDEKTLIAGTETRTSSPVRIPRDETGQSRVRGLYPAGEGAGYAGGITSAAVDGIRTAEAVIRGLQGASGDQE